MEGVTALLFKLAILMFSVMIHEVSHGYTAERLGDPTARLAGRLTLNPLKHLELFGSFIVPVALSLAGLPILAWARPVPYNPLNFKGDYRLGSLKVALAGPLSNIAMVAVFGVIARAGVSFLGHPIVIVFSFVAYLNALLAVFNLIPIPPLDGSKILPFFFPARHAFGVERVGFGGIFLVLLFLYAFPGVIFYLAGRLLWLAVGSDVILLLCKFGAIQSVCF